MCVAAANGDTPSSTGPAPGASPAGSLVAGVLTKPGNELVSCKKRISLRLRPRIGIDQTDQNSPNTPPGERERKYFLCNGRKIYCYVGSPVIMHNIQYYMAIGME